ncbi:hypothetical protein [Peribacillus loiseleuriae]|uniref:hypothetical protein n=1 Tax=Peribacillus loiseleuriae TaxID=1679170 RepID=UPI003D0258A4
MKKKLIKVGLDQFGLTNRKFLILFLLHELSHEKNYPKSLHDKFRFQFPEMMHSYEYLCKVAKLMADEKLLLLKPSDRRNYFCITDKGIELLPWHQVNFSERLYEINKVLNRCILDLTGSCPLIPVERPLPIQFRPYFSKLVSVKDLVTYVILNEVTLRRGIYMSEIYDLLQIKFGWESSNSYLYDISAEMEKNGLLIGLWEGEKRTRKFLTITEKGIDHFRQITDTTTERLLKVQTYLDQILTLLASK